MTREFQESIQPQECNQGACALGDFAMMRQSNLGQFDRQNNSKLEDAGVLPKFDLKLTSGDDEVIELKKPVGENIASKEMQKEGMSSRRYEDADKKTTTVTEKKDGVKVTISEGGDKVMPSGKVVHVSDTVLIEPNGKIKPRDKNGDIWVDEKGRGVLKKNEDGSVLIYGDDGQFYKQDSKGIKKVTAIREPGGNITEIDVHNPLGEHMRRDLPKM